MTGGKIIPTPWHTASSQQSGYDQVVEEILSGHLAPGSKVELVELMRRFFQTTTDLRQAIVRLTNEGLAHQDGPAALRINPVSVADLEELTATRVFIERETLVRSVQSGGAAWEATVMDSYAALVEDDPSQAEDVRAGVDVWEQRNHVFHIALISACPIRRLREISDNFYRQHERYRRLLGGRRPVPQAAIQEHQALHKAAIARDAERAGDLLVDHIRHSAATLADGIADGSWFGSAV
ncbi:MAG TPA: GntR family transcriptional regulator [Candidatus Sulfotelmatobacter sp.]|jgi:DNA-binding GntR family transcriptional regulator|nr:GntR family transcriptional regulator [Candidatus Sulfotelmatobacter sp.]